MLVNPLKQKPNLFQELEKERQELVKKQHKIQQKAKESLKEEKMSKVENPLDKFGFMSLPQLFRNTQEQREERVAENVEAAAERLDSGIIFQAPPMPTGDTSIFAQAETKEAPKGIDNNVKSIFE